MKLLFALVATLLLSDATGYYQRYNYQHAHKTAPKIVAKHLKSYYDNDLFYPNARKIAPNNEYGYHAAKVGYYGHGFERDEYPDGWWADTTDITDSAHLHLYQYLKITYGKKHTFIADCISAADGAEMKIAAEWTAAEAEEGTLDKPKLITGIQELENVFWDYLSYSFSSAHTGGSKRASFPAAALEGQTTTLGIIWSKFTTLVFVLSELRAKDDDIFKDDDIIKSLGAIVAALDFWISTHYKDNSRIITELKEQLNADTAGGANYLYSLPHNAKVASSFGGTNYASNRVVYLVDDSTKTTKILFGTVDSASKPDIKYAKDNYEGIP